MKGGQDRGNDWIFELYLLVFNPVSPKVPNAVQYNRWDRRIEYMKGIG